MAQINDQTKRIIRSVIIGKMELYGKEKEEVAIKCRFTVSTLHNKLRRPETITVGELIKLCEVLHISGEELKQMCGVK